MLDENEVTKIMDIDRERIRHEEEVNRLKVLAILYPMKIKCLLKKWKRKPLRQLHTNIIIFPKKEQVEQ